MKKLNIKIILLSFIATAILLFGGWYTLHFFEQEKPITDWIADKEGVTVDQISFDQEAAQLELTFDNKENFGPFYIELKEFLKQSLDGKEVQLRINPNQSESHPWWLQHSSAIIEAWVKQDFTAMSETIEEWKKDGLISAGQILMNSEYIFIYLHPVNQEEIYIVFPIQCEGMKGGQSHD